MATQQKDTSCCCPNFEPEAFQDKEITWKEKLFVQENVFCLFYIPLNFGGMMTRVESKLSAASAKPEDNKDFMTVQRVDPCSPWSAEVYVTATKDAVPDLKVTRLSGTFLAKVYEGPYSNIGTWVKDMHSHVKDKKEGKDTSQILAWYPTCPGCAKKYGTNYVVMLAQV